MKRLMVLLGFGLATVAFAAGATAVAESFYGSLKSDVYHKQSCSYVKKITKEHMVTFESKEDAQKKGYRPCKVCKP